MSNLLSIFLVGLGGAFGSIARYLVGNATMRWAAPHNAVGFPWGTLLVNILGCAAIGVLAVAIERLTSLNTELRLLLITGFLGGFTTFSAFALDAVTLFERGASLAAATYLILSIGASIAAAIAGIGLMRSLL